MKKTFSLFAALLIACVAGFAETTVFYESFNKFQGKGGNDGLFSGNNVAAAKFVADSCDVAGWTSEGSVNSANQCVKAVSSSATGAFTTPAIVLTGDAVLTFKAASWGTDATTLAISAEGATLDKTSVDLSADAFADYTVNITKVTGDVKITFAGNAKKKRFFLDEVKVTIAGEVTPVDATGIEVKPATAEVEVGKTVTLKASPLPVAYATLPEGGAYRWASDKPEVATVDQNGVVTGVAEGTADITVTYASFTAKATVTVKKAGTTPVTPVDPAKPEMDEEAKKWAGVYTSNIVIDTLGTKASACEVSIGGKKYEGMKLGTSSVSGEWEVEIPQGAEKLYLHAASWKGAATKLEIKGAGLDTIVEPAVNAGISNTSPFSFDGDAATTDYFFWFDLGGALAQAETMTVTASGKPRFVVFGVNVTGENVVMPQKPEKGTTITDLTMGDAYYFASGPLHYWEFDIYKDLTEDEDYVYPLVVLDVVAKSETAINGTYAVEYGAIYYSENDSVEASGTEETWAGQLVVKNVDDEGNYSFKATLTGDDGKTYTIDAAKVDIMAMNDDTGMPVILDESNTALEVSEDKAAGTLKFVKDGKVFIMKAERLYDVQGKQMK